MRMNPDNVFGSSGNRVANLRVEVAGSRMDIGLQGFRLALEFGIISGYIVPPFTKADHAVAILRYSHTE